MNILLINSIFYHGDTPTIGGVEYHRITKPHAVLRRNYPEHDIGLIMAPSFDLVEDVILNQTDLVVFSRQLGPFALIQSFADKLNKLNIPFALDLDDYWHLPQTHRAYKDYKHFNTSEATELSIRLSTFVICTTPYLAEKIKPFNENVYIIENGIDTQDEVWQQTKTESNRLRFGFTQGNTHYEDLKSISKDVASAFKSERFYKQGQICLTGFSAFQPVIEKRTTELEYERMLTDNLKVIRRDYPDYVHSLRLLQPTNLTDVPYRRIWSMDVLKFATVYDEIDVSVVPLIDNEFNSCKSELKMLEAGFKDCAVMVSHVKPYTLLATDQNSFDLNKKSFSEWANILIKNPNRVEDSKAQLKEDVKKYDLRLLAHKRKEIYFKYKPKK